MKGVVKYEKGIATSLFNKMYNKIPKGTEITVTTYRENDTKGKAARALYKKLGFIEVVYFDFLYCNRLYDHWQPCVSYSFSSYYILCDRTKGDVILAILKTNIKEYREKTNMKQIDLAEKIGVRRETIVHLENGRYNPSLKMAMDIAKVFNTTVEELFQFKD